MKRIFITWEKFSTRSHNQARHFDAKEIYIYPFGGSKRLFALMTRYSWSFVLTLKALWAERADVIFCLNQPPFLVLAVYLYTRVRGGVYVLDSHSAAFNDPKWAWFRPMYRVVAKRAFVNINTNERHRQLVQSWGGRSIIISDVPIDHEELYEPLELDQNSVAVVASYMFDEPIEAIFEAAATCPEIRFYVTGDKAKLSDVIVRNLPANVTLTGYLPRQDYYRLLVSARAVMVLTTRDDTMQMGAYEALSLGRPIITSEWKVLRDSFGDAALYVDNTPASIAQAVTAMVTGHEEFRRRAIAQRQLRRRSFEEARAQINELLKQVS